MRPSEKEVIRAAILWWRGKRPVGWNGDQHRQNPAVNANNEAETELAHAVAVLSADALTPRWPWEEED